MFFSCLGRLTTFGLGRLTFSFLPGKAPVFFLPGKAHRFLPGKTHFLLSCLGKAHHFLLGEAFISLFLAWEGSPLFAWEGSPLFCLGRPPVFRLGKLHAFVSCLGRDPFFIVVCVASGSKFQDEAHRSSRAAAEGS